jgi:hypothetical protein
MYFEQFCFLDYDWITQQVKQNHKLDDRQWFAFMGGLVFSGPPYNKELYKIFYPHYERLIEKNISLKSSRRHGLTRHLTAFYFWKYETLSSKKLLFKFLNEGTSSEIGELINFISMQEDFPKSLSEVENREFRLAIIDLWTFLLDKFENSSEEQDQKNISALTNWIIYSTELYETFTKLIVRSIKKTDKMYSMRKFLKRLVALKGRGNPKVTAKSVGEIISHLSFKYYIDETSKELIKELVLFLYSNDQNEGANKFCNKMAATYQQFFLREIYEDNIESRT